MKERNLKQIDGKWYLDFTFRGKRIRQFGGFTKEQARIALAKIRVDRLNERLGFKRPGEGDRVPFDKFADDFIELYAKQNKRSWRRDEASLKNLKPFFKDRTLRDIGPEDGERYKAMRRAEVSAATVNREIACLKTMFNQAIAWGKLEKSPLRAVKNLREAGARERILSSDEARRLLECAGPGIRPILVIALGTGMRRGEILSLKWTDIDFGKSIILIETSKSGKSRRVPMSGYVYEMLRALPRSSSEYVFFNADTGNHIKDIKTSFRAACRRAGFKGLRLHDCRHTFATWYMENGGDIVALSKILGHATIEMTARYCNPTWETMRQAVGRVGEILDPTRQKVDNAPAGAVVMPAAN